MRTTYLLPCECGHGVHVTSVQSGETVQCSGCGAHLTAPPLREMRQLEVVNPSRRRRRDKRWGARKICMMLGFYLAAGALIVLAILWARRPEPPDFSTLSPLESWQIWMDLRQGLQGRISWHTYHLIAAQRHFRLAAYACGGTAVIGIGMALTAFLMRKPRARV
ncbi:MAG: hypothetical protein ACODAD_03130 [Planctomycetota bacterium]